MPVLEVHHLDGYSKTRYEKAIHSCRIIYERSESVRQRRTALRKSEQQQKTVLTGCSDPGSKDWFNAWSTQCLTALFYVVVVGLLTKVTFGNIGEYIL